MVAICLADASPYRGARVQPRQPQRERVCAQKRELPCLSASTSSTLPSRGGPHASEIGGERGLSRAALLCEQSDDHSSLLLLRPVKTRSVCIIYHVVIQHTACFVIAFSTNIRLPELRDAGVDGPPASSIIESERQYPLTSWNGRRARGRAAEMEDAPDLKSGDLVGHVGSTPTTPTTSSAEIGGIQMRGTPVRSSAAASLPSPRRGLEK